jgi:DTW domain-containing protein YfiP
MNVAQLRKRVSNGERFFLVALDGTWDEAKDMLRPNQKLRDAEYDHLALDPVTPGLFAGCRKPLTTSCVSTLEAVALALQALEPASSGEAIVQALMRPMLRMVDYQIMLTGSRQRHRPERPGYLPGLTEAATSAAAHALGPIAVSARVADSIAPVGSQRGSRPLAS